MVEQQRKRVEGEMTKVVEKIDRSFLRKMQSDMHRCAASCCDNESYTIQKLHSCIQNCGTSLNKAQEYVQEEFERVQNRLQRCVMDCNDKIKDKIGLNPNQTDINKFSEQFENCATKCVDNYCDLLPAVFNTIKNVLASKKFE